MPFIKREIPKVNKVQDINGLSANVISFRTPEGYKIVLLFTDEEYYLMAKRGRIFTETGEADLVDVCPCQKDYPS